MSIIAPADNLSKDQELLAATFDIAQGPSFWFVIADDPYLTYSLANRLGFHSGTDFTANLVAAGLAKHVQRKGGKVLLHSKDK